MEKLPENQRENLDEAVDVKKFFLTVALPILVGIALVVGDQLAKYFSAKYLTLYDNMSFPVIKDFLHFTYVKNTGAAWGILSEMPIILYTVSIGLVILLTVFLFLKFKRLSTMLRYSVMLIWAGALGNVIDRVFLGFVRDMIDFRVINFAVFNVADIAITIGSILLCYEILFGKTGRQIEEKHETEDDLDSEEEKKLISEIIRSSKEDK